MWWCITWARGPGFILCAVVWLAIDVVWVGSNQRSTVLSYMIKNINLQFKLTAYLFLIVKSAQLSFAGRKKCSSWHHSHFTLFTILWYPSFCSTVLYCKSCAPNFRKLAPISGDLHWKRKSWWSHCAWKH